MRSSFVHHLFIVHSSLIQRSLIIISSVIHHAFIMHQYFSHMFCPRLVCPPIHPSIIAMTRTIAANDVIVFIIIVVAIARAPPICQK
jgi:hypothetical protein